MNLLQHKKTPKVSILSFAFFAHFAQFYEKSSKIQKVTFYDAKKMIDFRIVSN